MNDVEHAIDNLSNDELDLLHSDPKLLADFKAKYSPDTKAPTTQVPHFWEAAKTVGKTLASAFSPELTTAVEAANSPVGEKVAEAASLPYRGLRGIAEGVNAALPSVRAGKDVGLDQVLPKAAEAVKPDYEPKTTGEKVADFAATFLDPRTLLVNKMLEGAAQMVKKPAQALGRQAAGLAEALTGVDEMNFRKLASDPIKIMTAPDAKAAGEAYQAAKEAAGVTSAEDRALALKEGARKRLYSTVMSKVDNLEPLKAGEQVLAEHSTGALPDQTLTHIGPMIGDKPEFLKANGMTDEAIKSATQPMYNISQSLAEHPAGSSLSHQTLTDLGYTLPERGQSISVADILKAKKAGELIAKSDPAASGLIYKEIHDKLNPLLEKMAPKVYEAQQLVHIAKVKESFMNLFPQGKGLYKVLRVMGAVGSGVAHPALPLLESPAVMGAATVAGSGAVKAITSPLGLQGLGSMVQTEANRRTMQSLKDRLKNARK